MDMLPIRPTGSEYIKPATSTANDGGSKGQGGYINLSGHKEDQFNTSDESKRLIGEDPVVEDNALSFNIKEFFAKIIKAVMNFLGFKTAEL